VKRWYALYTKPHKERQVSNLLEEKGIETYLPTVRRKIQRRDRPERVIYFPCYLFARVDFGTTPRSSIAWMPGMRRIVSFGEHPAVVDDELIFLVRRRLGDIEEVAYGNLKQGDMVRITSGPLRDLEAIFDRPLSAAHRVRVLLDVMGRMTPADIDYSDITPL
jgi:transcription elongation factor/antiterminator RfaH